MGALPRAVQRTTSTQDPAPKTGCKDVPPAARRHRAVLYCGAQTRLPRGRRCRLGMLPGAEQLAASPRGVVERESVSQEHQPLRSLWRRGCALHALAQRGTSSLRRSEVLGGGGGGGLRGKVNPARTRPASAHLAVLRARLGRRPRPARVGYQVGLVARSCCSSSALPAVLPALRLGERAQRLRLRLGGCERRLWACQHA